MLLPSSSTITERIAAVFWKIPSFKKDPSETNPSHKLPIPMFFFTWLRMEQISKVGPKAFHAGIAEPQPLNDGTKQPLTCNQKNQIQERRYYL